MSIPVAGKIVKGFVGTDGVLDDINVQSDDTNRTGVLVGAVNTKVALDRLDGTGIGAAIFQFSGPYSAQNSNIDEWFDNRQQVRMRCISTGGITPVPFDLPGATALNAAFDILVAAGLPEVIRLIIEYTAATSFLTVRPRAAPSPQIGGTTSIPIRPQGFATLEVTRTSGVISDYVFQTQGVISGTATGSADAVKLINPSVAVWDASTNGTLPSTGVVKGNAYNVVNAPSDGSGRFGEVMATDDWVVWDGEAFTSWSAEPHQWFVLPAHDVRRITALEQDYLADFQETPVSDRNTVIRGADYADTAGELRLKIYTAESGTGSYDAADLNTTGDIDEYTNASDITGTLGIRLDNALANQDPPLTDLFVYAENADGTFVLIGNMQRDFAYRGDFGGEADYTSINQVVYTTGQTIRIYRGTTDERYNNPNLDIIEENLSPDLQDRINAHGGTGGDTEQRLASLEAKMAALFPLTPDVAELVDIAGIFDPEQTTETVVVTDGYSLMADYRGDSTRYEQTGVTYDNSGTDVVRYTGLTDDIHRVFGFKVTAPADQILLWTIDGSDLVPVIDMTAAGNFRFNNYNRSTEAGDTITNEYHRLALTSGNAVLQQNEANVATYTITDYPTGSTGRSRTMEINAEVLVNGSDTGASHFFNIPIPDDNTAQARSTIQGTANLGPLRGNRQIPIDLSYELRISGSDLLIDFRLVSVPSDVTISLSSAVVLLNYTAAGTATRTDNWLIANDGAGDFTFTGEAELLTHCQPLADGNTVNWVPVVRRADGTVDQLNDVRTALPHAGFDDIEIPDFIDFRTFLPNHWLTHSELATLVARTNTQWVYGLATLQAVGELRVNDIVDFPLGIVITASPNNTRLKIVADDTDPSAIKLGVQEV